VVAYPSGLTVVYDRDPSTGEVTSLRNGALGGTVYASGVRRAP